MPSFKSKTIIEYISSKSKETINFEDEDQYSKDLQEKIDEGYELLSLENKNGLGYDLLSFAKLKFEADGKTKFILLETDAGDCDGDSDNYHVQDADYGDDFGLKYSATHNHFFTNSINFFGGSFGDDVYFENLGVNNADPTHSIHVKNNWNDLNGDIFVGSNGEPVVYIEGRTIFSKLPVEVKGGSANWKLNGGWHNETLNKAFNPNQITC